MTKRGVQKPKKKSTVSQKKPRQTPADLWGKQWRYIKFVSGVFSFGILFTTVTAYSQLGDAIDISHLLPGFLIDAVMFVMIIFFLMSPYSPLNLYGKTKHRWLFGWVFSMALITHLIANMLGLLYLLGIL